MIDSNIRIVLENGSELQYSDPNDLGIKLNRIVEDFTNPGKRFGEFSYTFSLPVTKNNRIVWEFPDAKGRTRIFRGKSFRCRVFNGSDLLLEGIIELSGFNANTYSCVFYSSVTGLLDDLKGKKLSDLTSFETIVWDYENSVVNHIRSNYLTSDDSDFVFPLVFYQTPFWSGATEGAISLGDPEIFMGYYGNEQNVEVNPRYYSAFPPAFFLVKILEKMFNESGWSLGGSFFQRDDLKKIIIPFTKGNEDYSGAIVSGSTGSTLNLNKLLPDMDCIAFISSVINLFNLYFTIDSKSKQINFETYNTLFTSTSNPYDITAKLIKSSIEVSKIEDEPTISFSDDSLNNLVAGYNRVFDYTQWDKLPDRPAFVLSVNNRYRYSALSITNSYYGEENELRETYREGTFNSLFNKESGTGKDIKLGFNKSNMFSWSLLNYRSISGYTWSGSFSENHINFSLPLISPQTAGDNHSKVFTRNKTANFVEGNSPKDQDYGSGVRLYYYYGFPKYNNSIAGSPTTEYKDWLWVGISTGGTATAPTFARVPVTFASPFKLLSVAEKNRLLNTITGDSTYDKYSVQGAEAHNLLMTYFTGGKVSDPYDTTSFSLTLGENSLFPNLYSVFHERKFLTVRNGHLLNATMRMNSFDWSQMQINRPIWYDNELYQLVAIKNYNPVERIASITLLKRS